MRSLPPSFYEAKYSVAYYPFTADLSVTYYFCPLSPFFVLSKIGTLGGSTYYCCDSCHGYCSWRDIILVWCERSIVYSCYHRSWYFKVQAYIWVDTWSECVMLTKSFNFVSWDCEGFDVDTSSSNNWVCVCVCSILCARVWAYGLELLPSILSYYIIILLYKYS